MPTRKVTVGAFTGALMVVIAWAIKQWGHVDVPAEVAVAASGVLTFAVQYMVPDAEQ